jgi:hypothetical protein
MTLKRNGSEFFCNNNKKDHHNKRSLYKSRLQRRFEFQTRSIARKGIKKKWLPISEEKRSKFNKMMKLGISLLLQ